MPSIHYSADVYTSYSWYVRMCFRYYVRYKINFFQNTQLFCSGRGSFLELSAAGHAEDPPVRGGSSVGPGRALWRVPWAFKVAKSGK